MIKRLTAYLFNFAVGELIVDKGEYSFAYKAEWLANPEAMPISNSLPLDATAYHGSIVRAFFANLLPENRLRRQLAKFYGLSEQNDFGLLEAIGGDCAGAISLLPDDQAPPDAGEYKPIDVKKLRTLLQEEPSTALQLQFSPVRISLAGAQNKLAVYIQDGHYFIPYGNFASSHIIKPDNPDYPGLISNEFFCMRLAQQLGLRVANVSYDSELNLLVVERYDRQYSNHTIVRIHQEDFCQALGIPFENKYQREGGPKLVDCFDLIRSISVTPASDIQQLLMFVIYNYLIGNADAHAKNLSLIYTKQGTKLAPFYDLLCTEIHPNVDRKIAMYIAKNKEYRNVLQRHWFRLADENDISQKLLLGTARDLLAKIVPALSTVKEDPAIQILHPDHIIKIDQLIRKRAEILEHQFKGR